MNYHTLYTLGYAGWSVEQIAGVLDEHDAVLVDVRLNPWSQWRPEMRKASLHASLVGHYVWLRDLGNVNYKSDEPITLHNAERGLIDLEGYLRESAVVLMCGCRDVQTCHRLTVAELARVKLGVEVVHLEST